MAAATRKSEGESISRTSQGHRSQGSSFGDVFVAPDVFRADPSIRQQLSYVAVSRARTGVWLIGASTPPSVAEAWRREFAASIQTG